MKQQNFEGKLLARYPNNTKLIEVQEPDNNGNRQLLMYENGLLLTTEKFSGVVYINETEYEVYSDVDLKKTGMFKIGYGTDWKIETPNQKRTKATTAFNEELEKKLKCIYPNCFCSYPRIIDYIIQRGATESIYLFREFLARNLISYDSQYNQQSGIETVGLKCKICNSKYVWRYNERGIDEVRLQENNCFSIFGLPVEIQAPNFLDALFDKVFCRSSYLYRENLYDSDLNTMMKYLFEETAANISFKN